MDANLATTDAATKDLLGQAHRLRLTKFGWQMGSLGAALITVLTATFGAGMSALFDFGLTGNGAVLAMTLIPLLSAVLFFVAGKRAGQESFKKLDEAWRNGVTTLYSASGGHITADQLARGMGVTTEEATQLLAEAEVNQFLGAGATAGPPRVRVAPSATAPPSIEEQARQELEEALGTAETQALPSQEWRNRRS